MVARPKARDRTHEDEAREGVRTAERRISKLTRAIGRGEDVAGSDLATARADLEIAEAGVHRGKRLDREAERDAQADRLAPIYAEIEAYEVPEFAALLREVHTAANALAMTVADHNRRVSGWQRALSDAGAASDVAGAVSTPGGARQTTQSVPALLGKVFHSKGDSGIAISDTDAERVEKLAAARAARGVEIDHTEKRPNSARRAAERAAELRYRRDTGRWGDPEPFDVNRYTGKSDEERRATYPVWIDDPELLAMVPHITDLNPKPKGEDARMLIPTSRTS